MTFKSIVVLLLLVIDPLGNIPLFVSTLRDLEPRRRLIVILRECSIAGLILILFMLAGDRFLSMVGLSEMSVGIAGGIILFLIALRIVFCQTENLYGSTSDAEPLIVPLAIPSIAGPSTLATVLLLGSKGTGQTMKAALALILALVVSATVLCAGSYITRVLGERGVMAFQRLMGLILTAMAVQMFLRGVQQFIQQI